MSLWDDPRTWSPRPVELAGDARSVLNRLLSPVDDGALSSTRAPSSNNGGWANGANAYISDNLYSTSAPKKNQTRSVLKRESSSYAASSRVT